MLYANAAGFGGSSGAAWTPEAAASAPAPADRPLLDRWLLSEVHACVRDVTAALEAFDTAAAGRRLAGLIDDLSNWYVRRSRRRFWDGPGSADGASAFATLHAALVAVTTMMAPITPFLSDYLWGVLRPADAPESVHLAAWPRGTTALIDPALSAQMALARRLVELGRSARSAASVRTRQPLSRALVGAAGFAALPPELRDLIAEELNVHVGRAARRGRRRAGQLHGQAGVPRARQAVRLVDPGGRGRDQGGRPGGAGARGGGRRRRLGSGRVGGGRRCRCPSLGAVSLTADDLVVTQTPLEGWGVATAAGETVALDLAVSDSLRAEGWAREVVRLIQDARKSSGLDVSDRIELRWATPDADLAAALTAHGELIAGEVLAVSFGPGEGPGDRRGHLARARRRGPGPALLAGGRACGLAQISPRAGRPAQGVHLAALASGMDLVWTSPSGMKRMRMQSGSW